MTDYSFSDRHQAADDRLVPGISARLVDTLSLRHFADATCSSASSSLASSPSSPTIGSDSEGCHVTMEQPVIGGREAGDGCLRRSASFAGAGHASPFCQPEIAGTVVDVAVWRNVLNAHSIASPVENCQVLCHEQTSGVRLTFNDQLEAVPPVRRSASSLDAKCAEKRTAGAAGPIRRGGGTGELRNGWAAKSPKSYWLRRHSDSLLVADVPQSASDHQLCRQVHQGSSGYCAINVEASRDKCHSVSGCQELSVIHVRSMTVGDEHPPEAFVGIRQRPTSSSVVDSQPSSSSPFECDDVFDDEVVEDRVTSPKKAAYGECYTASASSPVNVLISSPGGARYDQSPSTTDDISFRFEQLQPGDRRLSRSQRSSGSIVDDQCCAELPKIVEERDEEDVTHGGLSSFRLKDEGNDIIHPLMMHKTIPVKRDMYLTAAARSPTQLTSSSASSSPTGLKVESLNVDDSTHVSSRRQLVLVDSSSNGDHMMSTSLMRRSRPTAAASALKSGRHQHQTLSPSTDSSSSMTAGASSGVKLHRCSVCRRSFARSDMLERHARLHTGVRPYSCRLCAQVFSRSDHLTTHLRTHTGEKPYQCPRCSYSASRRDMVTRHLRVHVHDNLVDADGRSEHGGGDSASSLALLSPLTVTGSLIGKRRPVRTKKRERYPQHRPESGASVAAAATVSETDVHFGSAAPWPLPSPKAVESFGASGTPSTKTRRPMWMSPIENSDSVIKAAVDSWTRSMVASCLASPPPIRSPACVMATSYRHGNEETSAAAARGLSMIMGRGSTGSTDSYSSPGCCSITGGSGDVFEFGGLAEGSPDVFRSPAAAARQTLKFLWPLVPQPLQAESSPGSAPTSYESPTM